MKATTNCYNGRESQKDPTILRMVEDYYRFAAEEIFVRVDLPIATVLAGIKRVQEVGNLDSSLILPSMTIIHH